MTTPHRRKQPSAPPVPPEDKRLTNDALIAAGWMRRREDGLLEVRCKTLWEPPTDRVPDYVPEAPCES